MEISKFTGWKYNFIECTPDEITTKLMNGEIDLAGAMLKNDFTETLFDFPEYDIGASYYTISVLKNNTTIVETDFKTLNNITVGVVEGSSAIDKFYKFIFAIFLTELLIFLAEACGNRTHPGRS